MVERVKGLIGNAAESIEATVEHADMRGLGTARQGFIAELSATAISIDSLCTSNPTRMMLDFLPMARLLAFLPDRAPCAFMWLRAARAAQSTILRETGRLKFSHLV